MKQKSNAEKARHIVDLIFERSNNESFYEMAVKSAMEAMEWKDKQILLDDDDKLATEVKVDGVTITPPQGYLIGRVSHINDSLIVELKKK